MPVQNEVYLPNGKKHSKKVRFPLSLYLEKFISYLYLEKSWTKKTLFIASGFN